MGKKYKYREKVTIEGKIYDFKADSLVELGKKIERKRSEIDSDIRIIKKGTTVTKWFETFIAVYKTNVSDREIGNLNSYFRTSIKPHIGQLEVKEVMPINCHLIMNSLEGKSKSYASKIRTLLYSMFDAAEENNLTARNPARKLKLPEVYERERRNLTPTERKVFLRLALTLEYGTWLMLMMLCGLRPSETKRIKGVDFNLEKMTLYIDGTKSKKAKRTVPIPNELLPFIENIDFKSFDFVFKTKSGRPIDDNKIRRMWKSIKREVNIKMGCKVYSNKVLPPFWVADDLSPDCFRHEYASDLKAKGVPSAIIADMLGHEETSTTAGYTHASEASMELVRNAINSNPESNDKTKNSVVQFP